MELKDDSKNDDLKWERISVEHIVQDQWMDIRRCAYRFPDGNVFEPFYNYSRRDYVVVVAIDPFGKYICVKQFRHGIDQVTTEFPAGGMERKDGRQYRAGADDIIYEDALEAAKRELREETGYASGEWMHLLTIPSNATIADNNAYIYAAYNCRKVADQKLDDTEFLNVELIDDLTLDEMVKSGDFQQSIHVMAWLLEKKYHNRKVQER